MMRRLIIEVIPHAKQAYETVGNWQEEGPGDWRITVSQMGDWRYHVLVAVHELVEMALCVERHIAEQEVTAFDVAFEAAREPGNDEEPGDQPEAPYYDEHQFATCVERLCAHELGVDWPAYDATVAGLTAPPAAQWVNPAIPRGTKES